MQPNNTFKKLTFFDVTNLLVGAIVGAIFTLLPPWEANISGLQALLR